VLVLPTLTNEVRNPERGRRQWLQKYPVPISGYHAYQPEKVRDENDADTSRSKRHNEGEFSPHNSGKKGWRTMFRSLRQNPITQNGGIQREKGVDHSPKQRKKRKDVLQNPVFLLQNDNGHKIHDL